MGKVLKTLGIIAIVILAGWDIYFRGERIWQSPAGKIAEYLRGQREARP